MKKLLPLLLGAAAIFVHSAMAQTATTTPVGAMTYSFPATTQATITYLSIPLTNTPTYSGSVQSFTSTTITFAGTPFTAGDLAQVGSPYFVRLQTGTQAGRYLLVTANTTNTVTVDVTDNSTQPTNLDASGFSVAANDQAQIIPGDTFASLFGDNTTGNPIWLTGTNLIYTKGDAVGVYNKSTSKFDLFYFNTASSFWRPTTGSAINVNTRVIYPDACIQITQRTGRAAVTFTVTGEVPTVSPMTKTTGGSSAVYASSRYPVDVKLSQLAFPNWTKNDLYFKGDNISIYNPTTSKWDLYYQRAADGIWRKNGDNVTNQSNLVIPAGQGILITKRAAVSGATSFLSAPLPYSL